ncbi:MAG: ATP-binding protein [Myxococcota bacterium]
MTGLKRYLEARLTKLLRQFPVVVVVGVRQCGKTTLVKRVAPKWAYVDLEDPKTAERVSYDPAFFLRQHPRRVIFDEVQALPALFRSLRGAVDARRTEKGRYLLTGSSSPELLRQASETLAGRVATVQLGTLKASELARQSLSPFYQLFGGTLNRKNLVQGRPPLTLARVQRAWLRGGYPEPALRRHEDFHAQWMDSYHSAYVERDISRLFPRLNRTAYRRFITMLCHLSGTILNKRNLARALEVNEGTIRSYLDIAAGTFLWRQLPSFEKGGPRGVTKMPKGHLRDTGLLHFLLHILNKHTLDNHPIIGLSFEGFVVEEILKGLEAASVVGWRAYHYRTRGGAEIDLVLQGAFGTLPVEVKCGARPPMRSLQTLVRFVRDHRLPFGVLVNQSDRVEWLTPQVVQIPVGWL